MPIFYNRLMKDGGRGHAMGILDYFLPTMSNYRNKIVYSPTALSLRPLRKTYDHITSQWCCMCFLLSSWSPHDKTTDLCQWSDGDFVYLFKTCISYLCTGDIDPCVLVIIRLHSRHSVINCGKCRIQRTL